LSALDPRRGLAHHAQKDLPELLFARPSKLHELRRTVLVEREDAVGQHRVVVHVEVEPRSKARLKSSRRAEVRLEGGFEAPMPSPRSRMA
jgi:hypothetical protein